MTRIIIAIALGLTFATSTRAATASVNATLEPTRISLDEATELTVSVQANHIVEPELPNVDGLEFALVGKSSSFQSINGAVAANVSFHYQVTATKVGTFNIPAIKAGAAASKPLQLQVVGGNSGASQRSPSLGRALPPPNVNSLSGNDSPESANGQPAFLHVVTPKQELYVGEVVPVQIKAYFRRGMSASLNGLPVLSSDAFTMSKLPKQPEQSQEMVEGRPYTVVTWTTALAPVKAGDYTLNLELPVMVRVQDRSARRASPLGSMFDDSFFDDFFGRVSEKPITLKTDLTAIKVLPLPTTDRPGDFSGAVGTFEIRAEPTSTSASVGEPVALKLTVSGTGNFDRVTTAGVKDDAGFKTYKPSMRFEPADNAGLQGEKIFEQAIVPQSAGDIQIPAVAFSYFDPEARKYVTQETEAISLNVTQGSFNPAVSSSPVSTPPAATAAQTKVGADELQPNAVEAGKFVSSLKPVVFRPWYPFAVAAPLVLLGVGLWLANRRERSRSKANHAANEIALRESLDRMDRASQTGAVTTFFISARHALQERLAQIWHVPPHAVTVPEINARLQDAGAEIRAIFQAADQAAYAGHGSASVDLSHWRQVVHDQLKRMENL
ncbi:MAG TPA: BatD family protein [Verrucomicrobiae bacterium]|nr:BatD family protein [Verrucomicrobiae bacterium]